MTYDPHKHNRRSIRLKGYDYSQAGAYFVTICVDGGLCLLGQISGGDMILNWCGYIAAGTWLWLAEQYAHVELDVWQIMPNHLHGIIVLTDVGLTDGGADRDVDVGADRDVGAVRDVEIGAVREPPLQRGQPPAQHQPSQQDAGDDAARPRKPKPLGRLVGAFKTVSTAQINRMQSTEGARFWQRDFYDRVIRNKRELEAIRTYIYDNPVAWDDDSLHPDAPENRFNAQWRSGPAQPPDSEK